jgi:hypothetical protein
MSVASTYAVVPPVSTRLRDLTPETDGPRIKGLIAKMTWLKGKFTTESEIANSYGGTDWLDTRMPRDNRMDRSRQMVRLGLTSTAGTFKYGLTYRNAGRAFLNGPDQANRELWGDGETTRSSCAAPWDSSGIMSQKTLPVPARPRRTGE